MLKSKSWITVFFLLVFSSLTIAQDNTTAIRLRILSPGLFVEQAFSDKHSLLGGIGIGGRYVSDFYSGYSTIYFMPVIKVEGRNYFSSYDKLSGAYISAEFKYRLATKNTNPFYTFGSLIGYQYKIGDIGYWNISVGGGIRQQNGITLPDYLYNIGVGIVLGG